MSGPIDDEHRWAADKREFVADSRDDAADTRDALASARDALADDREARLNEWEAHLEARASQLGLTTTSAQLAAESAEGRTARTQASRERAELDRRRVDDTTARETAKEKRLSEGRATLLALAFARVAEQLYDADTYDEVMTRIAEAAVATIAGGDMAAVTLLEGGTYRTAGSTDPAATDAEEEQYRAGEGPSLDAITTPIVSAPAYPDERWPALGDRLAEQGVHSSLSYHLDPSGGDRAGTGSLSIYAMDPAAFDAAAQELGFILAAHASLAARAVGERTTLEGLTRHLEQALLSRDVIGQAKGIVMERLKVSPDEAFDILKSSSQRLNVKLREVARKLAETGETPRQDPEPS